MDFFGYKNEKLYAEDVSLHDIAQTHGTPVSYTHLTLPTSDLV